jgi:hypothetical protein
MRNYPGMPELLEQFMQEQGTDVHWVAVQELRDRFGLKRITAPRSPVFYTGLSSAPSGS